MPTARISWARVKTDCSVFFGIGTLPIQAGAIVLVFSFDVAYAEYSVFANLPETTFVHISAEYLEVIEDVPIA